MINPLDGKLLIISEKGIGDGLTLIPCLQEIQRIHPQADIDFLAIGLQSLSRNFHDLANIVDPSIQQFSIEEKSNWLKSQDYKWVWNTENKAEGWRKILNQINNPDWISAPPHRQWPKKPVIQLRLQQLRILFPKLQRVNDPFIQLTKEQESIRNDFAKTLKKFSTVVAIQPSGNDPRKIWSKEKYHKLIEKLTTKKSTAVVLFLTKSDLPNFGDEVLQNKPNLFRIVEPLKTAIPKLAACKIFIGNDSGFYHLAHALGLSVVGIYRTVGSKKIWSYRTQRARAFSFFLPHIFRDHWQKFISVKRVIQAVDELAVS